MPSPLCARTSRRARGRRRGPRQLGYYWDQRPGVYPAAQIAQSDFARFNVGSQLAQDNVDAVRHAGEALGLDPSAQQAYAQVTDPNAFSQPTFEFYPDRVETADASVSFYATAKKSQGPGALSTSIGSTVATQGDGAIRWNFGDARPRPSRSRRGSRTPSRDRACTG